MYRRWVVREGASYSSPMAKGHCPHYSTAWSKKGRERNHLAGWPHDLSAPLVLLWSVLGGGGGRGSRPPPPFPNPRPCSSLVVFLGLCGGGLWRVGRRVMCGGFGGVALLGGEMGVRAVGSEPRRGGYAFPRPRTRPPKNSGPLGKSLRVVGPRAKAVGVMGPRAKAFGVVGPRA